MRKFGLIAATAVASISVAGVAQAVDVNQGLEVVTKGKKGTKTKNTGLKLTTTTTTSGKDPKADGTYATKKAVIHFDKNLVFNSKTFPTCDEQTVATNPKQCPVGSKVGTGSVEATLGADQTKQHPSVTAFNAKGGKIIFKLTHKDGEVDSDFTLTGTLAKDTGKFGSKLNVPIPTNLQNQFGLFITLNKFLVAIPSQKYKGKYYVASKGCSGGKYQFRGDFTFTDGSKASAKDTSVC